MIRLNENGFITTMSDTIIYNNNEEYDDYGVEIGPHHKINPNVFFNDRNSSKFDILMYECNNLNQYIRLPITNESINSLRKKFMKRCHLSLMTPIRILLVLMRILRELILESLIQEMLSMLIFNISHID